MPTGRLLVSIELLPSIGTMLPSGARIVGSKECLGRGVIALAVESDTIAPGSDLVALVQDFGLSRIIEIKERC
ncbi:MAG: hypothetical protein QOH47_820 [Sphingomonadales bacterium]|nr:hypothetical protein [Sphingomonadales bacterium]